MPAASVAFAVIALMPAASATSRLKFPELSAVTVPSEVVPLNSSTRALASAVPVIVSPEVWLVTLSLLLEPVSSAEARSRPVGAAGAVVSTVIDSGEDAPPTLPAASVAFAVIALMPAASATSRLKFPELSAVTVPSEVVPLNSSTRALASAVPVIVSPEVWLVTLSLLLEPVSSAEARSRPVGAAGAVVSRPPEPPPLPASPDPPPAAAATPPRAPRPRTPRTMVPADSPPEGASSPGFEAVTSEVGAFSLAAFSPFSGIGADRPSETVFSADSISAAPSSRVSISWPSSTKERTKSLPSTRVMAPATTARDPTSTTSIFAPENCASSLILVPRGNSRTIPFFAVSLMILAIVSGSYFIFYLISARLRTGRLSL